MKRLLYVALLGLVFVFISSIPASSARPPSAITPSKIPLDACIYFNESITRASSNMRASAEVFAWTLSPYFLSVKFVTSLEEADDFDIAIRISQHGNLLGIDILSPQTQKIYNMTRVTAVPSQNDVILQVFSVLGENMPLRKRLIEERQLRLAKVGTKRKESVKEVSQPDKQDSAAAIIPGIRSDVDELPLKNARPNKNAYAIVIGIENYRQKLPKADFAVSDAKLVSEYLTKVMGYPEENIVLLTNDKALQSDLAKYFEKWLHNNVEKDGTVFIYYSGHGAPNPKTGDAFLVPYDGDPSFIEQTGYSLKRMYDALGKLPAKEIIVALDSCFSGAGGRSVLAEGARPLVMNLQKSFAIPKNMTVLAAAAGDQISSTYKEKGHGLFTYFMLKGIKNEDVVNTDGSIEMDDLFGYLKPQVERIARKQYNNEQSPQLIGREAK